MKIVCFGDSVTRGITYMSGRLRIVKNNYPALLQRFLGDHDKVINKGVFNDNSDLLIKRLEKDVLSLHPDLVLIHIGGNDCNFDWSEVEKAPDSPHEPIVPLNRYLSNIKELVERIRLADATPVIFDLLPIDPRRYYKTLMQHYDHSIGHWIACCGGIEHWHGMYNRALNQLVQKVNAMCFDVRTAFKNKGDFADLINDDGLHPSEKGYQALAEIVNDYIVHVKQSVKEAHA